MAQSKAWLLELGNDYRAAVGNQYMVEYLVTPEIEIMPVPLSPDYSPGVMVWRKQIIPVIDLVRPLNPGFESSGDISGVMVLAYQDAPGTPLKHGALAIRAAPENIMVNGDSACAIPISPKVWQKLAIACFSDQDDAIPILNVQIIFSTGIRAIYQNSLLDSGGHNISETELSINADTSAKNNGSTINQDEPVVNSMQHFLETADAVIKKHSWKNQVPSADTDTRDQANEEMPGDTDPGENVPDVSVESGAAMNVLSHSMATSDDDSEVQQLIDLEKSTQVDLTKKGQIDSAFEEKSNQDENGNVTGPGTRIEMKFVRKTFASRMQRYRDRRGPNRKKLEKTQRRFGRLKS